MFFKYWGLSFEILLHEGKVTRVLLNLNQGPVGRELSQQELVEYELELSGFSDFEREVLRKVKDIPPGRVATYKGIARAVGRRNAARAVGGVMARNPFPILIPCHRVIRSDLSVGNYTYGSETKALLLRREGVRIRRGKVEKEFLFEF